MKLASILKRVGYLATAILTLGVLAWALTLAALPAVLIISAVLAVLALVSARFASRRIRTGTILEVDLDAGVIEAVGADPLSRIRNRSATTVRQVVDALTRAGEDPRVGGLVARIGNGGIQTAHAQELRDAVHKFRAAGKKTVAFSESFGESANATIDYYVASAFETIILQPNATASIQGLLGRGRFVRGLLDKLGVYPDMGHRKEYKAAMYMLTETSFTDAHRQSVEGITKEIFDQMTTGIASDRGLSPEVVHAAIDNAPLVATEALDRGLIDMLAYRDDAYAAAGEGARLFLKPYLKKAGKPHRKGDKIGLIHGSGAIYRGTSSIDPLSGDSSMGADDIARAFREATDNKKLKAIIFRVDSPGGSAVGSEVIRREVVRARKAGKPVVVSMGNVAASGGYWISANANKIVALPGTITGSIGVVSGKLASRNAWAKAGITFDHVANGAHSTYSLGHDPYTDSERARLEAGLDTIYDDFTGLVSEGRGLALETVEGIAKGRVWTGTQAKERGLVDELGGLETAIELTRIEANIEPTKPVTLVEYPMKKRIFPPQKRESSDPISEAIASAIRGLANLSPAAVQVRMPDFEIR